MNRGKVSWLMVAVALPALLFGAMASVAYAEDGFDPAKADRLIQIALLDDSVMNGSGWTTRHNDWDESPWPDTTACKNSLGKLQDLEKSLDTGRAGRGKVTMVQDPEGGEAPVTVEIEMYVYKTAAPLKAAFPDLKKVFVSNDLVSCVGTALDEELSGAKTTKAASYFPQAADDPKAAAFAAEVKTDHLLSPIRLEIYSFYVGNTLTTMTFTGPKPAVNKSTVEFLVQLQGLAVELLSGY